ncbi:hypothetical protein OPV22_010281 [Ensete ventricosum]|uniref:Uncharacterized protein n=1 Tax=Ensete ventricosum TaxID=4639 RepID=A0AAV8RCS1_ENSVE|nr:hypothetical protein OPV22_010281 [Ensete ventricosum]
MPPCYCRRPLPQASAASSCRLSLSSPRPPAAASSPQSVLRLSSASRPFFLSSSTVDQPSTAVAQPLPLSPSASPLSLSPAAPKCRCCLPPSSLLTILVVACHSPSSGRRMPLFTATLSLGHLFLHWPPLFLSSLPPPSTILAISLPSLAACTKSRRRSPTALAFCSQPLPPIVVTATLVSSSKKITAAVAALVDHGHCLLPSLPTAPSSSIATILS